MIKRWRFPMPRKPISVWITQVLIALLGLVGVVSMTYYAVVMLPGIPRLGATKSKIFALVIIETIVKLAIVGFFVSTVVLISRRSPLGRWFGLICLAAGLGFLAYGQFNPSPPTFSRHVPMFVADNDAQKFGMFVGELLSLVLYLLLMMRFGFSRASKAFFATYSQR